MGKQFSNQLENLLIYIKEINVNEDWKIAIEFRNNSWYHEDIYELLNSYNAAMVVQDIPKSATQFLNHSYTFLYLRFYGPTGNYRESYSNDFLREFATIKKDWID